MAPRLVGLDVYGCRLLASADLAFVHGQRATLWHGCGASARLESTDPYSEYAAAVRPALQNDGGVGPERVCRRPVRRPSAARGIGGVGCRTERRSKHPILDAHHMRLSGLCPAAAAGPLLPGVDVLRAGTDGEADAGVASVCIAAAGLLATATGRTRGRSWPVRDGGAPAAEARLAAVGEGESPPIWPRGDLECGNRSGAAAWGRGRPA